MPILLSPRRKFKNSQSQLRVIILSPSLHIIKATLHLLQRFHFPNISLCIDAASSEEFGRIVSMKGPFVGFASYPFPAVPVFTVGYWGWRYLAGSEVGSYFVDFWEFESVKLLKDVHKITYWYISR